MLFFTSNIFSQEYKQSNKNQTQKENDNDTVELPQGILDFRRFEIITLGSLPFVTLDVSLGYSLFKAIEGQIKYGYFYFPNPFKASEDYTDKEMKNIILTSAGICLGIGISDLVVNIVKRNKIKNANKNEIIISTIENDPEAIKIELNKIENSPVDIVDTEVQFLQEDN